MGTLYDELLASLTKQASSAEDTIKQGVADLDDNELLTLASELAELTGDSELAEMAKILPVYSSGQLEKDIQTEQVINNAKPEVEPQDEVIVEAAEDDKSEEKDTEDKEDDKEDMKEDEEEEKDEEDDKEVSAAETLYEILKEGAALEELIEVRAAQMVETMLKEAEDAEIARTILDQAATALSNNAVKAFEYSQMMMDKAKTVASTKAVNLVDAAKAVAGDVLTTAKAAIPTIGQAIQGVGTSAVNTVKAVLPKLASIDALSELSKKATELEASYEKLAEDINMIAEQLLNQAGAAQGLDGVKLHDFVMKGLEEVRTLAAKKDINIAQAAQEFLAGGTGAITGIEEPSVPSEAMAPSPVKAETINSNVTQSPDQLIPRMIAKIEPNPEVPLGVGAADPTSAAPAAPSEEVKQAAAAMLAELFKNAGINFNLATNDQADVGSTKQAKEVDIKIEKKSEVVTGILNIVKQALSDRVE